MTAHDSTGLCLKCLEIINLYPGFNQDLLKWFEDFQFDVREAHVSCAGRGRIDQEAAFHRGASRAHYGQSAHNYGAALDFFALIPGETTIYPVKWFQNVLGPAVPDFCEWYGAPGAAFPELPHVQIKNWKDLRAKGLVKLVE